jgi:hypothetical protein
MSPTFKSSNTRFSHNSVSNAVYRTETHRAVRRFQAPLDLDSAILSLQAARKLGLIAVPLLPSE